MRRVADHARAFQLGQAKPLLVLPLCLAVAVFEGEFAGALLGTVGGLLWDYAAGRTVGMLALELLLLCFGVSVLVQLYLQVNPGNFAAVNTITALLVLSLDWLFFYYMPGYAGAALRYIAFVLPSAVLTLPARCWPSGWCSASMTGSGSTTVWSNP